jgi:DNA-binding transcriptional MerR regulator
MTSSISEERDTDTAARLRSGTAARLSGVPVATLRVWERRYGVVSAPKTPTGQRLYSGHDVKRLRLIKQLTDRGHAIGTLAALSLETLQQQADADTGVPAADAADRRVLVGAMLAARLGPGGHGMRVHEDLDAAEAADTQPADSLVAHLPSLQAGTAERLLALARRLQARSVAVVYGFAAEGVVRQLRAAGVRLRRDPVDAGELARLLARPPVTAPPVPQAATPAVRLLGDHALVTLAAMPSTVACECPRHLAEIVQQLVSFERYSADCGARSPADAALHQRLAAVAGSARTLFERALLEVMAAEGIVLPA